MDANSIISIVENVGFIAAVGMLISSPLGSATGILGSLLNWLLNIFTFIAVISFIVTGIMFLFSGSNPDMREKAKSGVVYSIIGIAIGLSGYVILKTISEIFQGTI